VSFTLTLFDRFLKRDDVRKIMQAGRIGEGRADREKREARGLEDCMSEQASSTKKK
jgi:hypothetical protein